MKKLLLLFMIPLLALAQQGKQKQSDGPERFKIYTLSEFTMDMNPTQATDKPGIIFVRPTHPTKGEVVILLDTQTGNTWFLTTSPIKLGDLDPPAYMLEYHWEPIDFHILRNPTSPISK